MSQRTTDDIEQIARQYPEEVATKGNLDHLEDLLTDDYVEHGPFGEDVQGRDADVEKLREFLNAFENFEATVKDAVTEGDTVAMRVTLRGTHEGPFQGIEPTGNSIEVQNMVFTRVEDGKIAERWLQLDTLGLMEQLDAVERPSK